MELDFSKPLVIEVDFNKCPQIPFDKEWFILNNRRCRLLYTDRGIDEVRKGRFEYEDGETFTVRHRPFYGTIHDDESHKAIFWDRIIGWAICN